jgi:hypothetical protein
MRRVVTAAVLGLLAGPVAAQDMRTCIVLDMQNPRARADA